MAPAYIKELNGAIERINRTILNKVRCLLNTANLPNYMWGEAVIIATYLYNRTPHSVINYKTPYKLRYNKIPDITYIKTFGSIYFYKNKKNYITKLELKANKVILIRFNYPLYKVLNIITKKAL